MKSIVSLIHALLEGSTLIPDIVKEPAECAPGMVDEAAESAGIAARLKKWAQEDTDEETRRVTFIDPSGETITFADVVLDMASITDDDAAIEYIRWLQALPNLSDAARDIVDDMAYAARIPATVNSRTLQ